MAALIDATMPALTDHLAEEEQKLLPIVSVTLTQSERDALGKHGMSAIPLTRRLVMLGHITEETDDAGTAAVPAGRAGPSSSGLQADRPPPVHPRKHRDPRLTHPATRHHSPDPSFLQREARPP
jgi:hypothetical protein